MIGMTLILLNSLDKATPKSFYEKIENINLLKGILYNRNIIVDNNIFLSIALHKDYPFQTINTRNASLLFEGMIYSHTEKEIRERLTSIAEKFVTGSNYKNELLSFQKECEGDYVTCIYNSSKDKFLVFNDFFGRLPVYYFSSKELTIISRDLKVVLEYIPQIKFDKIGMTDTLVFMYHLRSKTNFKNIKQFDSCETISIDLKKSCEIHNEIKYSINLSAENLYSSRKKFIQSAASLLLESVKNCVNKLQELKYGVISDLSGGVDTRIILSCLTKYTDKVTYCSLDTLDEESSYAYDSFNALGAKGVFLKLPKIRWTNDLNKIIDLVFLTNALVNYKSTAICYDAVANLKENISFRAARFSGLGASDFFRKGYRYNKKPLINSLIDGYPLTLRMQDACKITKVKLDDYIDSLKNVLRQWPEKSPEEQFKKLYFRYQVVLQCRNAEDRERIHFWTVQPMWSNKLYMEVLKRFPQHWRGYYMIIQLLRKLDKRSIEAPFNHPFPYKSNVKLRIQEFKENNISYLKLKSYLLSLFNKHKPSNLYDTDFMEKQFQKLKFLSELINIDEMKKKYNNLNGEFNLGTTLLMYLYTLENRYKEKIL